MIAKTSTAPSALRRWDPRLYQIFTLASLLGYGMLALDFEIAGDRAATILAVALLTQYGCTRLWKLPAFDPRSALISGLSLCLMLRTNSLGLALTATIITIASKFLLRFNGKHLFNPTNFGIVAMMLLTGQVWVSPGQWGNVAFFAFLMACLGGLVVNRAARSDVTYAFIAFYMALVFGRSIWLGEPLTIPLHRLENGALLLFTFFMISDPRTTPNSRLGRILFAAIVAFGAWYVQFRLFRTNGLLWSLALFSMTVPLIDWLLPGRRYEWSEHKGGRHVSTPNFQLPRLRAPGSVARSGEASPELAASGKWRGKRRRATSNELSAGLRGSL
jgi:enediyne biosynthesis protein E5